MHRLRLQVHQENQAEVDQAKKVSNIQSNSIVLMAEYCLKFVHTKFNFKST